MTNKRIQIPRVISDDPDLQRFIDAVINNNEHDLGRHADNEQRPTKQQLIDAGVPNAENIK